MKQHRGTFHLMSGCPETALSVPSTGSQSSSVRKHRAGAKHHWKQTLKLPTDYVQIFQNYYLRSHRIKHTNTGPPNAHCQGGAIFSLFPDERVPSVLFQRQSGLRGATRGWNRG